MAVAAHLAGDAGVEGLAAERQRGLEHGGVGSGDLGLEQFLGEGEGNACAGEIHRHPEILLVCPHVAVPFREAQADQFQLAQQQVAEHRVGGRRQDVGVIQPGRLRPVRLVLQVDIHIHGVATGTSHRDPADILAEQQHVGLDQLQGFAHGAGTLQCQPGDAVVGKAVVLPQAQAFQGGASVQHDPLVERFAGQARLGSRTLTHVRRRDALHGEVVVEWSPLEIVLDVFGRAHRLPLARDAIALKASGLRYSMRMSFRLIFVRWASGNHYLA